MNRIIRFKGKCIQTKKLVYGCYGTCEENGDNGGVEHHYRETSTLLSYIISEDGKVSSVVYPDTVKQFTGLQDVDSIDIYDGDVVESLHIGKFVVKIGINPHTGVSGTFMVSEDLKDDMTYILKNNSNLRVVGNVHEKQFKHLRGA